jgi:hypothetical protein
MRGEAGGGGACVFFSTVDAVFSFLVTPLIADLDCFFSALLLSRIVANDRPGTL